MKRLHRLAWLTVATLTSNIAVWTMLAGCGPDNTVTDAGPDGTIPDGKADVQADVVNDVNNDVSPGDGGPDVAAILQFQAAYAAGFCGQVGKWCFKSQLDASVPSAALTACEAIVSGPSGGGFENAIRDLSDPVALNSGHINISSSSAASCLAGLSTMTLPMIPGSEYSVLAQNCLGTLSGTLSNGSAGCRKTVECANGYCSPPDGGFAGDASGTCTALSGSGGPCESPGSYGNSECMYRGWVGTPMRCDLTTPNGTAGTGVCTPKIATSGGCWYEWDCQTDTCDDNGVCQPTSATFTVIAPPIATDAGIIQGTCGAFFPDSGVN